MVGYGASRRVDPSASFSEELRSKSRALRYSRVAGLFEEAVTTVPLSSWLPRLRSQDPERHSQAIQLLNDLLAPHAELSPEPSGEEYVFRIGGADVPLRGFVGRLPRLRRLGHRPPLPPFHGVSERAEAVGDPGVVLVDEVDLHLHPEWQQRVIPTLARVFPRLQFIFTSHSPLLVGTVHGTNVFGETEETEGIRKSILRPSEEEAATRPLRRPDSDQRLRARLLSRSGVHAAA